MAAASAAGEAGVRSAAGAGGTPESHRGGMRRSPEGSPMPWDHDTAESYDELGRQSHEPMVRRLMRELLPDVEDRRVLDFGCGPGNLALALAGAGAREVVGVDESREMIDSARATLESDPRAAARRVRLLVGDESALAGLGRFDAALCSLVLMMCATRERLERVTAALVGALEPGGRLLAVITHPCFRKRDFGAFHYELPEGYDYWRSGAAYDVVLTPKAAGEDVVITDYHWTLTDYVTAFARAGGVVAGMRELPGPPSGNGGDPGPPAYLALLVTRIERT